MFALRGEQMTDLSRREALTTFAATALAASTVATEAAGQTSAANAKPPRFRIRTLTAGVQLKNAADLGPVESALAFLKTARQRAIDAGHEVQTIRVATNPLLLDASPRLREAALPQLTALDRLIANERAVVSIGPVFARGTPDDEAAAWASNLVRGTRATSFTIAVATPDGGINAHAIRMAAEVTLSLSRALPGGVGNFRFAAAANIPAGTPFFPAAYHEGDAALSVGLETPNLVREAFAGARDMTEARDRLRNLLDTELAPIEKMAQAIAQEGRRRYLGIDSSPAPGADSSIGAAIEALTGVPIGSPSTLQACAAITEAIKSLRVQTCGYSGLMLPILEDPVLASRAAEGRISVSELLLFSSVCGTGLDVVPLAGDVAPEGLRRVIGDMATLAHRLRKPLSARLFPVPGKAVGDTVAFDDPLLFASRALPLERAAR
jgi:uncharacterized protein (UPF0210 family)